RISRVHPHRRGAGCRRSRGAVADHRAAPAAAAVRTGRGSWRPRVHCARDGRCARPLTGGPMMVGFAAGFLVGVVIVVAVIAWLGYPPVQPEPFGDEDEDEWS